MNVVGWSTTAIFLIVVTLDAYISTVLVAHICSLRPSEVARERARSVIDDVKGKVTKIRAYLRR